VPARTTTTDATTPTTLPPAWVTVPVAAERLSLSHRSIRRAIESGDLTAYKFGKSLRLRLQEVDAWAESRAVVAIPAGGAQ